MSVLAAPAPVLSGVDAVLGAMTRGRGRHRHHRDERPARPPGQRRAAELVPLPHHAGGRADEHGVSADGLDDPAGASAAGAYAALPAVRRPGRADRDRRRDAPGTRRPDRGDDAAARASDTRPGHRDHLLAGPDRLPGHHRARRAGRAAADHAGSGAARDDHRAMGQRAQVAARFRRLPGQPGDCGVASVVRARAACAAARRHRQPVDRTEDRRRHAAADLLRTAGHDRAHRRRQRHRDHVVAIGRRP